MGLRIFWIVLIIWGSFMIGLTTDSLGDVGNILMKTIGVVCIVIGLKAIINKKKYNNPF